MSDLRFWSWASGEYLTKEIPLELLDLDRDDYDEANLDKFIDEHRLEEYEFSDIDYIWDKIENLAWSAQRNFVWREVWNV